MHQACHLMKSMVFCQYQLTPASRGTEMHSLETTKVLQLLRQSRCCILPCPDICTCRAHRKKAASGTWNDNDWLQFPFLKGSRKHLLKNQTEMSKRTLPKRNAVSVSRALKSSLRYYAFPYKQFSALHSNIFFEICSHYVGMRSFHHSLPIFELWLHS